MIRFWPWCEIADLKERVAIAEGLASRQQQLAECLIGYLDHVTGDKHCTVNGVLFIVKNGAMYTFSKSFAPPQ